MKRKSFEEKPPLHVISYYKDTLSDPEELHNALPSASTSRQEICMTILSEPCKPYHRDNMHAKRRAR